MTLSGGIGTSVRGAESGTVVRETPLLLAADRKPLVADASAASVVGPVDYEFRAGRRSTAT